MLLHVGLILPQEYKFKWTKVKGMSKDPDVKLIFTFDQKILLNSTLYDVDFPNQAFKSYAEKQIATNMYSQIEADDYSHTIIYSII